MAESVSLWAQEVVLGKNSCPVHCEDLGVSEEVRRARQRLANGAGNPLRRELM